MPGETYTPSFAKGVVAGSTGALGRNESAVAPFTIAVQQRWSQTDRNVSVAGASVVFDDRSRMVVLGGERDGAEEKRKQNDLQYLFGCS